MTPFERLWNLRESFRRCFTHGMWKTGDDLSEDAYRVLRSLRQFCRADVSTFDADPRVHALLEGRREVWIEIQNTLHLSDAQLIKLRQPEEE